MTHTHHHPNSDGHINEEIELEPGEIICNKCNGTGVDPEYSQGSYFRPPCTKCQGDKKLDWISAATGVAPKEGLGTSSWVSSHIGYGSSGYGSLTLNPSALCAPTIQIEDEEFFKIRDKPINEYIKEIVATELSKKIEAEILESFKVHKEQTLNTKRRKFFDNRIFSKLMFYCNFKQRFKSKKDKNII